MYLARQVAVSREVRQNTDTVRTSREYSTWVDPPSPGMVATISEIPVANTAVGTTVVPSAYLDQM